MSGWVPGFAKGGEQSFVYLVDSETYYPLAVRFAFRQKGKPETAYRVGVRFLIYERLQFDAAAASCSTSTPIPGAKHVDRAGRPLRG